MAKKILFIINGLGLGNSTRCHAIIQELVKTCDVAVITSGNGAEYFKHVSEISELHVIKQLQYGGSNSKISIARTIMSLPKYLETNRENSNVIENVLTSFAPDAVVLDSTYVTRPIRAKNIPILAINNSDFIVSNYLKMNVLPPLSTLAQFLLIECLDFFFHYLKIDVVISPFVIPGKTKLDGKFKRINPLIRKGYKNFKGKKKPSTGLIMLSGSAYATQVNQTLKQTNLEFHVIGREKPKNWPKNRKDVVFHGKVFNNNKILKSADFAIINCGYSAISECISLKLPVVVVPVSNHAEQWVNAMLVHQQKLGIIAGEDDFNHEIELIADNYEQFAWHYSKSEAKLLKEDGNKQAADIIIETALSI